MPEVELGSQNPASREEDFEELSSNADLYVFNHQMVQGYRGVNINTRDNEESLGDIFFWLASPPSCSLHNFRLEYLLYPSICAYYLYRRSLRPLLQL